MWAYTIAFCIRMKTIFDQMCKFLFIVLLTSQMLRHPVKCIPMDTFTSTSRENGSDSGSNRDKYRELKEDFKSEGTRTHKLNSSVTGLYRLTDGTNNSKQTYTAILANNMNDESHVYDENVGFGEKVNENYSVWSRNEKSSTHLFRLEEFKPRLVNISRHSSSEQMNTQEVDNNDTNNDSVWTITQLKVARLGKNYSSVGKIVSNQTVDKHNSIDQATMNRTDVIESMKNHNGRYKVNPNNLIITTQVDRLVINRTADDGFLINQTNTERMTAIQTTAEGIAVNQIIDDDVAINHTTDGFLINQINQTRNTTNNIMFSNLDLAMDKFWTSPCPTGRYMYNATLDSQGRYVLFWNISGEDIIFEVHVRTYGYIGFGFSLHGGMFPADLVMGWVDDGVAHFADYHTMGDVTPVMDESQDWALIHAEENKFGTVFKFSRLLNTCDDHDRIVSNGVSSVIYAYGHDDPQHSRYPSYHGPVSRGQKQISLLDPNRKVVYPSGTKSHDFVNINVKIPPLDTFYICTIVRSPETTKHHFIEFAPVVSPDSNEIVHHMAIFGCDNTAKFQDGYTFNCLEHQSVTRKCMDMYTVITKGAKAYQLPDHVGITFGTPSDPQYFMVQVHYNNAARKSDLRDSSGIRGYYTPAPRQYNAGVLLSGVIPSYWNVLIPPFQDRFISIGHCPSECLEQGFQKGTENIKIFAAAQHTHILGKKVITRHIRNGIELKPIVEDRHMNFNFQGGIFVDEVTVEKGDTIRVDCTYDSSHMSSFTHGGYGTSEEMCISFIMYYPKMTLGQCYSMPLYQQQGDDITQIATEIISWDFTKPKTQKHFQKLVFTSDYMLSCQGGNYTEIWKKTSKPVIRKAYRYPERNCSKSA